MSLWNFLGEFAVFNMICNMFSGKSKSHYMGSPYSPQYRPDPEYAARIEELEQEISESKKRIAEYQKIIDSSPSYGWNEYNADRLQDRIDELESMLNNCDVMSDHYDRIQDEIDLLQDRLDDMEDLEDIEDEPDNLNDYLYDPDFSHDDW